MLNNESFESQIRDTLSEATDHIAASDLLKFRIHNKLSRNEIKEVPMKKIFSVKKVVICAAAICCFATVSVFAAGAINHYTSSEGKSCAYTQIPSADKLNKDIGFTPKIIASFSNGYTFKEANIVNTKGESDKNETVSQFKELRATYTSANGEVTLTSYKSGSFNAEKSNDSKTFSYNGIELKYSSQVYKFVPSDYQLTDADKEAKANGSVVFSFGNPEDGTDTETIQSVHWTDGGLDYQCMTENTALSSKDLFSMAGEIISMN